MVCCRSQTYYIVRWMLTDKFGMIEPSNIQPASVRDCLFEATLNHSCPSDDESVHHPSLMARPLKLDQDLPETIYGYINKYYHPEFKKIQIEYK